MKNGFVEFFHLGCGAGTLLDIELIRGARSRLSGYLTPGILPRAKGKGSAHLTRARARPSNLRSWDPAVEPRKNDFPRYVSRKSGRLNFQLVYREANKTEATLCIVNHSPLYSKTMVLQ